jgi:hypothetical protein
MFLKKLSITILLFCCVSAADAQTPPATRAAIDETHLAALHASGYAGSLRAAIVRNCRTQASYSGSPLCFNIYAISDEQIEEYALPAFKKAVSTQQARTAYEFWTSRQGREIKKLLMEFVAAPEFQRTEPKPHRFSANQLEMLERYNKSEAGLAEASFAADNQVLMSVFQAIAEHY